MAEKDSRAEDTRCSPLIYYIVHTLDFDAGGGLQNCIGMIRLEPNGTIANVFCFSNCNVVRYSLPEDCGNASQARNTDLALMSILLERFKALLQQ